MAEDLSTLQASSNSSDLSTLEVSSNGSVPCCFLLKCSHRGQILPSQFELLLSQHQCNTIILRYGLQRWTITVTNHSFAEGWDDYCHQNIAKTHDILLLRHSGDLIFDVIHFCEFQSQVYLPWTVPLPELSLSDVEHIQGASHSIFTRMLVASSMKADLRQNLTDSICFYQILDLATPNTLRIQRFVHHFVNDYKTPTLLLRTGNKNTEIGVKGKKLKANWRNFVLEHELQHNDTIVFIPESAATFTVLIFDYDGVEKIFPWSHTFHIYSKC